MLQESSRPVTAHKLEMQNRNHVDLTGITEVVSFDNKEIELETIEGAVRFAGFACKAPYTRKGRGGIRRKDL